MLFLACENYKFCVGWSAKCGCTTVKRYWYICNYGAEKFEKDCEPWGKVHFLTPYVLSYEPDIAKPLFFFVVVRNPWFRVLSAFLDKVVLDNYLHEWLSINGCKNPMLLTFRRFVKILKNTNVNQLEHHMQPQQFNLGQTKIDAIVQLENIDSTMERLCEKQNWPKWTREKMHATHYQPLLPFSKSLKTSPADMTVNELRDFELNNNGKVPTDVLFFDESIVNDVRIIYQQDFEGVCSCYVNSAPTLTKIAN